MRYEFDVLGVPAPQGNKSAVMQGGKARLIEGNSKEMRQKHGNWRSAVAESAQRAALGAEPLDGPIRIHMIFRFQRPASRPKKHHRWHIVSPDHDKVTRATFDALSASGIWRDDCLAASASWDAIETDGWTGARIRIETIEHDAEQIESATAVPIGVTFAPELLDW